MGEAKTGGAWPWLWIPTLYFIQGLPYSIVNKVTPVLYKDLGVSNAVITYWIGWLSLLWAFKAFWSPLVDSVGTKRGWVVVMQGLMGPTLGLLAFALPLPGFFQISLALFFVLAFSSATYDVAADGFYLLGLTSAQQAAFVGVRSTFWRAGLIAAESGMVMGAGFMLQAAGAGQGSAEVDIEAATAAWSAMLGLSAAVLLAGAAFHAFVLPRPDDDRPTPRAATVDAGPPGPDDAPTHTWLSEAAHRWLEVVVPFFRKRGIVEAIAFIFFFRFAENMMLALVAPFMKDAVELGGLGLDNVQYGFAKGFVGVIALLAGGVLGGIAISRHGLKAWLWPMVAIMHLPDVVFLYLAWAQPSSFPFICALVGVEQFGYGFGFTAYMMFLMRLASGLHKTSHYAIATGLMALSVSLTTMWTGQLQEAVGYPWFFAIVLVSIVPGVLVAGLVRIEPEFGKAGA